MNSNEFFDVSGDLQQVAGEISKTAERADAVGRERDEAHAEALALQQELSALIEDIGLSVPLTDTDYKTASIDFDGFNTQFDELFIEAGHEIAHSVRRLPKLSKIDFMAAIGCGVIAAVIDFFLVGTPHKGHSKQTGSPMTDLLRKIGNIDNGLHPAIKWFEKRCKTPYDLSIVKNTATPNNHRLRSFGHDPIFGLLFAIFDCKYGTCTLIDNAGKIQIIPRDKDPLSLFTSILYYLGHLISDVFTSAGLPIPGWCVTQLFATEGKSGLSIARVAEELYREGFDLRHLLSMSSSVGAGALLLNLYIRLQYGKVNYDSGPVYQQEIDELTARVHDEKMRLIMNSVGTSGNLLKILAPPANGNPAAVNLVQWQEMIKSAIETTRAATRDLTPELVVQNRANIENAWNAL